MDKIDTGGFLTKGSRIETIEEHPFEKEIHHPGITRRDWLQGLAMQGMLANCPANMADAVKAWEAIPGLALKMADAMIKKSKES